VSQPRGLIVGHGECKSGFAMVHILLYRPSADIRPYMD
jgi:hypothetical protein